MLPRGVILVFCIIFVVFVGVVALFIRNKIVERRKNTLDY
ncbi:similar to saccharomyces cerevisiae YEL017C-A PMP2 Proteolipid associated with plasma membrane H(+)-ATPase (Pma1p) [Geotrichum candidum]|uniref:Similar to saccharomyces cerevisiae YEL017C-A PMP2 Proteolipid associated with plasma membrane H(+)-ATPase (Pma1p) n=1 Tax=Geotrichum candidum TaxID=1173061 RepID=A0A0J9X8S6_GEOCN|nr:similar to saccharomyces cerevisiae YEL017C-A PMP2 Proteolipid associated with plasma membrane H(+)-ATPase (Pma1p) [Geotrichum candidum]